MKSLQGKNAVVTGARTGIGKAIVERFAHEGVNVWAIIHREDIEWLHEMGLLSKQNNVWIRPVYIDLLKEEQIKLGIQTIVKDKLPIDILVNAAGVVSENRLIQMTSIQTMRDVMQVNFFAAVQLAQLVSRVMCRQKSGNIINIASIAGLDGDYAQLEYASSKAALICATKKMAYEWGNYGIRVNAIAPGIIETKMVDSMDDKVMTTMIRYNTLNRKGLTSEIAAACAYLVSEDASYITAQTIRVDGGGQNFVSTINK